MASESAAISAKLRLAERAGDCSVPWTIGNTSIEGGF
jgi:hypothetical protein